MLDTRGSVKKRARRAVGGAQKKFPQRAPQAVGHCPAGKGRMSYPGTKRHPKSLVGKVKRKLRQWQLRALVALIRHSGPRGSALIRSLEKSIFITRLYVATKAREYGKTVRLRNTGGGYSTFSKGGINRIYIHPSMRIHYRATDGSKVRETSAGLLLHELGHAWLANHNRPNSERAVRRLTNPIRRALGVKPERRPIFPK